MEFAESLIAARDIHTLSADELVDIMRESVGEAQQRPERGGAFDSRSGEVTLFNPGRATRPNGRSKDETEGSCPICAGETTSILDLAELSAGFTFINANMYPAVFPHREEEKKKGQPEKTKVDAWGMHFLQWTSSIHRETWHTMPVDDLVIVLNRLCALEETLLQMPFHGEQGPDSHRDGAAGQGSISIIKNAGLTSGGSIVHDHQQIIYSRTRSGRARQHLAFMENHGRPFSAFMLTENPSSLIVHEDEHAVLQVPYYMQRPYDLMLCLKRGSVRYLHELSLEERRSVMHAWKQAIQSQKRVVDELGLGYAYNVLLHHGPGAGIYIEFLPHTQTDGGFERMGLSVCQSNPQLAASILREKMK